VVSQELLDSDEVLALSPSIYQECIPGKRHLRISVLGERCDAALIETKELDWRINLNVPCFPHLLPTACPFTDPPPRIYMSESLPSS
jgi:hypothetical protein